MHHFGTISSLLRKHLCQTMCPDQFLVKAVETGCSSVVKVLNIVCYKKYELVEYHFDHLKTMNQKLINTGFSHKCKAALNFPFSVAHKLPETAFVFTIKYYLTTKNAA